MAKTEIIRVTAHIDRDELRRRASWHKLSPDAMTALCFVDEVDIYLEVNTQTGQAKVVQCDGLKIIQGALI